MAVPSRGDATPQDMISHHHKDRELKGLSGARADLSAAGGLSSTTPCSSRAGLATVLADRAGKGQRQRGAVTSLALALQGHVPTLGPQLKADVLWPLNPGELALVSITSPPTDADCKRSGRCCSSG
jgi:hypothetical protein